MEAEQDEPNISYKEALGPDAANPPEPHPGFHTLRVDGHDDHRVPPLEQRIKAQFEDWVREDSKQEAIQMGFQYSAEVGQRALAAYLGDKVNYNWDGNHCRNAREGVPGRKKLLWLLLRRCHPHVTEEEAGWMYDDDPASCFLAIQWSVTEGNSRSRQKAGKNATAGTTNGETRKAITTRTAKTLDED